MLRQTVNGDIDVSRTEQQLLSTLVRVLVNVAHGLCIATDQYYLVKTTYASHS